MQVAQRTYSPEKTAKAERIADLAERYGAICVFKLHKVRAAQIMTLKKNFRDRMAVVVAKNRIAALGLKKAGRKFEEFVKNLEGQNALIFTDISPFKLSMIFEESKVSLPAKAGDTATDDIVIPAGNTGIPPGPVLSDFKELKVPTRIETGSIFVSKDTVVAEKGDVVTPKLAGILSRLNIKPIKAGIAISIAYERGLILKGEDLRIDLDAYREELAKAHGAAVTLAVAASYPSRQTLPILISKAYRDALTLALMSRYPSKETIGLILLEAEAKAQTLYAAVKQRGYS